MKFLHLVTVSFSLLIAVFSQHALSWELSGTKDIFLHDKSGKKIAAGFVDFKPNGDAITFDVHWNHAVMKDYFLSMREFKCFDGQDEIQCQVPYPYKSPKTITPSNLAWLEHHLLFLFKAPKNFGANLWNGIYYELKPGPQGLIGLPNAVDLVAIGAPPDRLDVPPYGKNERTPMPEGARWFTHLSIE